MIDLSLAPDPISHLVKWLGDRGFVIVEERSSGQNNQYAIFSADDLTVKVTVSQGDWSLGIGLQGRTFHPDQWEAWFDGYPLAGDLADLEPQVDFIVHRWEKAVERARASAGSEAEIAAIGDDWVERRFGFTPPK
jgi:hypothetical protein